MKKILAILLVCLLLTGCTFMPSVPTLPNSETPETSESTAPETTQPETTEPETTEPETTEAPTRVVRVEQTFTGEHMSSLNNATILTGYDEADNVVWQWISDVVSNEFQLTMLTEFAESKTSVFVVVDDALIGLDRETGEECLEILGVSGASDIAVDGDGVVYVTDFFSGNVVAYNSNGVRVLDLFDAYPQLEAILYRGYGPEYLGGNVMKFCFEGCDDAAAAAAYSYADQNQWGWDYWYVLLDTATMRLILPD